ncbi:hypothetical protein H6802_04390 [Candidatus Nomurabacteria bacterium]|uniref:Tetratricopeptide repeat protein n=1 Tax=candidate division WWE3 bacterium TaxID=2053526 RepID=A0A955IW01_UNCKA|nr:hypothetical protein [candidate division WWE3 bacterium]MCB9824158.1 hypothetical protein [Candidatus Nomurabacteria bacterium]MCB9826871.1 hypothetical protein [Candidatus Nomurabacteria bacterium]MCB9828099.1 hypothetical protein [Candidatus Nomurabacteria bacterium]HXK52457.1 hypothetical protein [bacterium]
MALNNNEIRKKELEVYNLYLQKTGLSPATIKKLELSPEDVAKIITKMTSADSTLRLFTNAKKETRDNYLKQSVTIREQGFIMVALTMLDAVQAWDIANKYAKGIRETNDHKKIAYTLLADREKTNKGKLKYLTEASKCLEEALKATEGESISILKVHQASLNYDLALLHDTKSKEKKLKTALKMVDEALKTLPGSQAHRAWPLPIKAKILIELKLYDKALKVLQEAESCIYYGYEEEQNKNKQADMVLSVWTTGIALQMALLHIKTNKNTTARIYLSAVINCPDAAGVLANRKLQAKNLLKKLEEPSKEN